MFPGDGPQPPRPRCRGAAQRARGAVAMPRHAAGTRTVGPSAISGAEGALARRKGAGRIPRRKRRTPSATRRLGDCSCGARHGARSATPVSLPRQASGGWAPRRQSGGRTVAGVGGHGGPARPRRIARCQSLPDRPSPAAAGKRAATDKPDNSQPHPRARGGSGRSLGRRGGWPTDRAKGWRCAWVCGARRPEASVRRGARERRTGCAPSLLARRAPCSWRVRPRRGPVVSPTRWLRGQAPRPPEPRADGRRPPGPRAAAQPETPAFRGSSRSRWSTPWT